MGKFKSVFGVLFGFVCLGNSAFAETLQQAIDYAIRTNPEVIAAARGRLASDEAIRIVKGEYYPRVNVDGAIGREKSKNPSVVTPTRDDVTLTRRELYLDFNQELFTGFSTVYGMDRATADMRSSAHRVDAIAEEVGLNTARIYLEVLRQQELVRLGKENLAAHERTYAMIRSRAESGIARIADLDQAEGRLALARANLESSEGNYQDAKTTYLRIVGKMPGHLTYPSLSGKPFPSTKQAALQQGFRFNPSLRAAIEAVNAAKAENMVAKAPNYPQFSAQVALGRNENVDGIDGLNNDNMAMLRMTYNLYRGGSDVARQRQTAYLAQQAAAERERVYREVREGLGIAWTAMEVSRKLTQQYLVYRNKTGKTVEAYRSQFKLGQRSLLDLLDSENEYYSAGVSYVSAKIDSIVSQYRVLQVMGRLLNSVGIRSAADGYWARKNPI